MPKAPVQSIPRIGRCGVQLRCYEKSWGASGARVRDFETEKSTREVLDPPRRFLEGMGSPGFSTENAAQILHEFSWRGQIHRIYLE
jgi:hypothetical protein